MRLRHFDTLLRITDGLPESGQFYQRGPTLTTFFIFDFSFVRFTDHLALSNIV